MKDKIEWGLAGCGSSGLASIDIDQTISDPEMWQAKIDLESLHIRFSIDGPQNIFGFMEFLQNDKHTNKIQIGKIGNGIVEVRKDVEFDDRIFIVLNFSEHHVCFTIAGRKKIDHFIVALSQTCDDLQQPQLTNR